MVFELGKTVGGYEFLDAIETFGFGLGYKVRNLQLNRIELLKVLPRQRDDTGHGEARFKREIELHRRLEHPQIEAFYNVEEIEGQLVITTELVEGTSLEQRLKKGPIPLAEGIDYVAQALAALSYTHEQLVVHRCISPMNLMIIPEGTVKLTGFGFSKTPMDQQLTVRGFVIGVPEYVSPEQARGSLRLDRRSDIYSMGAVLYEVTTGRPPFESKSVFELMQAHVNTPPQPPSRINSEVPPELNRIILTALEKKPWERFQTASEFQEALESVNAYCQPRIG